MCQEMYIDNFSNEREENYSAFPTHFIKLMNDRKSCIQLNVCVCPAGSGNPSLTAHCSCSVSIRYLSSWLTNSQHMPISW